MASKFAKFCWNRGVRLNEAWREFASPELALQYEQTPGFLDSMGSKAHSELTQNLIPFLTSSAKSASDRRQLELDMKEELLTDLFNAQLIATGYREYPSRSQSPVVIDAAYFDLGDPNWNAETFENCGIRYGRIRICSTDVRTTTQTEVRRSKTAINQAIDKLMNSNPDFCKLNRKAACDQIRSYFARDIIPGNGLSDQNLAKAIVAKCGKKRIPS